MHKFIRGGLGSGVALSNTSGTIVEIAITQAPKADEM
jgi:hypothetical protein